MYSTACGCKGRRRVKGINAVPLWPPPSTCGPEEPGLEKGREPAAAAPLFSSPRRPDGPGVAATRTLWAGSSRLKGAQSSGSTEPPCYLESHRAEVRRLPASARLPNKYKRRVGLCEPTDANKQTAWVSRRPPAGLPSTCYQMEAPRPRWPRAPPGSWLRVASEMFSRAFCHCDSAPSPTAVPAVTVGSPLAAWGPRCLACPAGRHRMSPRGLDESPGPALVYLPAFLPSNTLSPWTASPLQTKVNLPGVQDVGTQTPPGPPAVFKRRNSCYYLRHSGCLSQSAPRPRIWCSSIPDVSLPSTTCAQMPRAWPIRMGISCQRKTRSRFQSSNERDNVKCQSPSVLITPRDENVLNKLGSIKYLLRLISPVSFSFLFIKFFFNVYLFF